MAAIGAVAACCKAPGRSSSLKAPAAHLAAGAGIAQFLLLLAAGDGMRASRLEAAAIGHVHDRRHPAGDRGQLAMARAQMRQRAQQAGRIGMQRPHQRVVDRGILDHLAGIHRDHARAGLGDDAEVVRDQHQRRVRGLAEVAQQFQDLRLHGDVERRGRLVGDQQLRPADQAGRDHHALAHAAGELMRIVVDAPLRRGDADAAEHVEGPLPRLFLADAGVDAQRLGDLVADGEHRIERAHRLLEDHGNAAAADPAHGAGCSIRRDRRRRTGSSRRGRQDCSAAAAGSKGR